MCKVLSSEELQCQLQHLHSTATAFITFASFEKRCLNSLYLNKYFQFEAKAVFYLKEFASCSSANKELICTQLGELGTCLIELSNAHPTQSVDSTMQYFESELIDKVKNLVVDITCFNREMLLVFLQLIKRHIKDFVSIYFIYNPAKKFSGTTLSSNLVSVRSVLGYGGIVSPLKKNHMIILLGYEPFRAKQIIEAYEPDCVTILTGSETGSVSSALYEGNRNKLGEMKDTLFSSNYGYELVCETISLIDAFETYEKLSSLYQTREGYNTIIAPLNNKISTVGVGLFALDNQAIQLCYSQMASYNFTDYSEAGDDNFYLIDLTSTLCKE